MISVASRGTTDRITARIFFIVLRAGSGTIAMYSSVSLGTPLPFFIREILQAFISSLRPRLAYGPPAPGHAKIRIRQQRVRAPVTCRGCPQPRLAAWPEL